MSLHRIPLWVSATHILPFNTYHNLLGTMARGLNETERGVWQKLKNWLKFRFYLCTNADTSPCPLVRITCDTSQD